MRARISINDLEAMSPLERLRGLSITLTRVEHLHRQANRGHSVSSSKRNLFYRRVNTKYNALA